MQFSIQFYEPKLTKPSRSLCKDDAFQVAVRSWFQNDIYSKDNQNIGIFSCECHGKCRVCLLFIKFPLFNQVNASIHHFHMPSAFVSIIIIMCINDSLAVAFGLVGSDLVWFGLV